MQLLNQTVSLEEFLPHVLAAVVGSEDGPTLPKEAALSYIRNSAINFSDKTGIIKRKIKVDLQCGLSEYLVETPDCETILRISDVSLGQFNCQPDCMSWSWGEVDFQFDDDTLIICPAPKEDVEDGLYIEAIVAPSQDSCEVDYQLYSKWKDAIVNGALSEIHLMSNQPWSSLGRSDLRRKQFEEAVSKVTIGKMMQGKEETLRMRPNPMWMRRGGRRF